MKENRGTCFVVLKEMRKELKSCMSKDLSAERMRRDITQWEMAELLHISRRSYVDLESGKNLCRLTTFISFLLLLDDPIPVAATLLNVCRKVMETDHDFD